MVFAYQSSSVFASEVVTEIATTATQTVLGKTLERLADASPYVSIAAQAYHIGQEIRKHTFPTIEEKAHAEEVAESYAFLTAENELQKCFINNRSSSERNRFGQPVACEDIAKMLNMLGGKDEVNRMTSIYNQYRI